MLDRMLLSAGGEEKLYVEDVFSTYLYTGNGSTQTITNGIDLAGKGGLVIQKERSSAYNDGWFWADTVRGANNILKSQNANGQITSANTISAFSSTGFTAGSNISFSGSTYASWTFRKAPKFFDVVTYTGTGSARTVAHSLGIAPGCIIVKRTDTTSNWAVYHRSNTSASYWEALNITNGEMLDATIWNGTNPTASNFSVGTSAETNASGGTYVAYIFAHDAASDGIIQCGTFTSAPDASWAGPTLGWEPQFVLAKRKDSTGPWLVADVMRGFSETSIMNLAPNTSNAEVDNGAALRPTATGFQAVGGMFGFNSQVIYIAIRRGPMKTPTVGTSVFAPVSQAGGGTITTNFPVDLVLTAQNTLVGDKYSFDRLRGSVSTSSKYLITNKTDAEATVGAGFGLDNNLGYKDNGIFSASYNAIYWNFRRAPGFFDEVCYTGTGNPLTLNHNLGVAPELIIYKARSSGYSWIVQSSAMNVVNDYLILNASSAKGTTMTWRTPTSTTFGVNMSGNVSECNYAGTTYVAYLFASCPGVSKVGSYTGNGSSQTINCGFSSGARFFLVKRTDSTGDWWVYDSARGIVAAADPALRLNLTAAEVTSADAVDTDSTGIIVNQEATCNINVNGGTYIYLAIA